MAYAHSVQCLVSAGSEAGLTIDLEMPKLETGIVQRFFSQSLAENIASSGYPGGIEIPWTIEELFVYSLDEISARQAGYRHDAKTNAPSVDWDHDRYVFADWAANPVSIGKDGGICYSRHGEGHWSYVRIATDLPAFFTMLAAWIQYFVVEHGGNLFDENFEINQDARDTIASIVLAETIPEYRDSALGFLLGDI